MYKLTEYELSNIHIKDPKITIIAIASILTINEGKPYEDYNEENYYEDHCLEIEDSLRDEITDYLSNTLNYPNTSFNEEWNCYWDQGLFYIELKAKLSN